MEISLLVDGIEVRAALSRTEGLELFRRYQPSLVVTDVQITEMTGLQLLKHIQTLDRDALLVFITGYSMSSNAVAAIKAEAYDYLTKPFSNVQLWLTVKKGLEYI